MNKCTLFETTGLDDLDLRECVVGPDLIARFGPTSVTLYRRSGQVTELLGTFDEPEAALAAVDAIDSVPLRGFARRPVGSRPEALARPRSAAAA
jgi:hypothetical protein